MARIWEICVWCSNGIQGNTSIFYSLCSNCRKSQEGREYVKKVDEEKAEILEKKIKGTRSIIPTFEEAKQGKKVKYY